MVVERFRHYMVSERWVQTLRDSVADAGFADGWSVLNRNGKVQVQHSWLEPGGSRKKATAMLPIAWERGCAAEVINALGVISGAMLQGRTLKDAVKVLGQRNDSADGGLDWDAAWEQFKRSKVGGIVSEERGFNREDGARWKWVRKVMEERTPQNATQLLEFATLSSKKDADGEWIELGPGTEMRRRKVQTIRQFLVFCRDELGFEERWHPPASIKRLIGVAPRAATLGKKQKHKKDSVPEEALKPLMASFPETPAGRSWRLAVGLLACFGLRPWELKFLEVEGRFLRVTEGKRNSRRQSDPRIVMGIDPEGMPGLSQQLLLELSTGTTKLPALGTQMGHVGNLTNAYLERQPFWKELKASAKAKGEVLASYSFRHRYAYAADRIGLNDREICQFMGNNRMTYVQHYGTNARESELIAAAERVLARA